MPIPAPRSHGPPEDPSIPGWLPEGDSSEPGVFGVAEVRMAEPMVDSWGIGQSGSRM